MGFTFNPTKVRVHCMVLCHGCSFCLLSLSIEFTLFYNENLSQSDRKKINLQYWPCPPAWHSFPRDRCLSPFQMQASTSDVPSKHLHGKTQYSDHVQQHHRIHASAVDSWHWRMDSSNDLFPCLGLCTDFHHLLLVYK